MENSTFTLTKLACMTAMALSSATPDAFAQEEQPEEKQHAIEKIMVTAQKRSESLQDVPVAMTVTTAEQLERDQIYSITDLQRTTPALEVSQSFGGESNGGGRMRGIGTNVFNETAAASVAIVVDQVPQGNVVSPQLFDLAQVEVLRGPQGTLFGQTASAGVIQVTTKAPDYTEVSGEIGADYAWDDVDRTIIRGALNVPVTDYSALRFSGRVTKEKGLQRNIVLDQDNVTEEQSYRIRYRNEAREDLMVDLIGEYNLQDFDGVNFFAPAIAPTFAPSIGNYTACGLTDIQPDAREYCAEKMSQEKRETMSLSAIVNWHIPDHTLTSVTAYKEKNIETIHRNYTSRVGAPTAVRENLESTGEQISQELRLSSDTDSDFQYIAGVFFSRYAYDTGALNDPEYGNPLNLTGFSVCATSIDAVPPVPFLQAAFAANGYWCPVGAAAVMEDIDVSSQAIFADVTYDVNTDVTLFGGLRYTRQKSEFRSGLDGEFNNSGDTTDNEVSGRAGVRWRISDDNMIYSSVSRGFKGSLVEISANPGVAPNILKPEIATSFEIGNKMTLLDGDIAIDTNLFFTKIDNFQSQRTIYVDAELTAVSTNVEEVESKGFEIDVFGQLTDSITLNAGYIYAEAEYPDGYLGDDGTDLTGEQLIFAPKHKFTVSGEYFKALGENMEAFVNANATYKSKVILRASSDPLFAYDGYWNIGASVGVRDIDGQWRASLFARNLTDEAAPAAYLAGDYAGTADGGVRALPIAGITTRLIGVSFDYKF